MPEPIKIAVTDRTEGVWVVGERGGTLAVSVLLTEPEAQELSGALLNVLIERARRTQHRDGSRP